MRRIPFFLSCAAFALPLIACQSAPASGPGAAAVSGVAAAPATLQRKWLLVALPGFGADDIAARHPYMDWSKLPQVSARMGCNGIGFSAQPMPGGALSTSGYLSTRMACGDMRLEFAFGKLLPTMTRWQLAGERLVLSNANGERMEFVPAPQ